jgi:hypothetical protein
MREEITPMLYAKSKKNNPILKLREMKIRNSKIKEE